MFNQFSTDNPQSDRMQIDAEAWDEEYEEEEYDESEELSLCEAFHFLLYQDEPDPEWEETHQKVLAGAKAFGDLPQAPCEREEVSER